MTSLTFKLKRLALHVAVVMVSIIVFASIYTFHDVREVNHKRNHLKLVETQYSIIFSKIINGFENQTRVPSFSIKQKIRNLKDLAKRVPKSSLAKKIFALDDQKVDLREFVDLLKQTEGKVGNQSLISRDSLNVLFALSDFHHGKINKKELTQKLKYFKEFTLDEKVNSQIDQLLDKKQGFEVIKDWALNHALKINMISETLKVSLYRKLAILFMLLITTLVVLAVVVEKILQYAQLSESDQHKITNALYSLYAQIKDARVVELPLPSENIQCNHALSTISDIKNLVSERKNLLLELETSAEDVSENDSSKEFKSLYEVANQYAVDHQKLSDSYNTLYEKYQDQLATIYLLEQQLYKGDFTISQLKNELIERKTNIIALKNYNNDLKREMLARKKNISNSIQVENDILKAKLERETKYFDGVIGRIIFEHRKLIEIMKARVSGEYNSENLEYEAVYTDHLKKNLMSLINSEKQNNVENTELLSEVENLRLENISLKEIDLKDFNAAKAQVSRMYVEAVKTLYFLKRLRSEADSTKKVISKKIDIPSINLSELSEMKQDLIEMTRFMKMLAMNIRVEQEKETIDLETLKNEFKKYEEKLQKITSKISIEKMTLDQLNIDLDKIAHSSANTTKRCLELTDYILEESSSSIETIKSVCDGLSTLEKTGETKIAKRDSQKDGESNKHHRPANQNVTSNGQ